MRGLAGDLANIAKKKQAIRESGFRLFSEKGIDAVRMEDISKDSKVQRQSMYRYFSTKLDLAISISTEKWREYLNARFASPEAEALEEKSAAEGLQWYMDGYIDLYRNHSDILRFNYFFNSYVRGEEATPEQMRPYMEVAEYLRDWFHGLYEKGMKDGTVNPAIPEEEMLSGSVHIMLAAGARYAVGLVYNLPERGTNPERELIMLKDALLQQYVARKETV